MKSAQTGPARWSHGRHVCAVSRAARARGRARRRAVGRRAADADDLPHADGQSRPDHGRRADRGPRAEARGPACANCSRPSPRRGVAILLIEQKLTIALSISHAPVRDGPGAHRVRRNTRRTCARTRPCARSGWRYERVCTDGDQSSAPRYRLHDAVAVITLDNPPVNGSGYEIRAGTRGGHRSGAGRCRGAVRSCCRRRQDLLRRRRHPRIQYAQGDGRADAAHAIRIVEASDKPVIAAITGTRLLIDWPLCLPGTQIRSAQMNIFESK